MVAGRFFTLEDGQDARVVNQAFARLCCPNKSPIGATVAIDAGRYATIVGVLKDAFDSAMDRPPSPLMFSPLTSSHVTQGSAVVHYASAPRAPTVPVHGGASDPRRESIRRRIEGLHTWRTTV
jgi:hypothetical protein